MQRTTSALLMQALLEDEKQQFTKQFIRIPPQCCSDSRTFSHHPPNPLPPQFQPFHLLPPSTGGKTGELCHPFPPHQFPASFFQRRSFLSPPPSGELWLNDHVTLLRRSPGGGDVITTGSGDCKSSSKPRRISTEKRKLKFSISAILSKDEDEEEGDEPEAEEQEQEDNHKLSPDTRRGRTGFTIFFSGYFPILNASKDA